ncbi:SDR family NAD(P)-dependent oxidoreductase [Streptomyces filipinensis]|nr:SDR family NAD(P)-dependent oxidoreductase [Streptomyces filipinensis]
MDISTATVLVTGAKGGLGRALAQELLARGATVYGAARRPDQIDLPGVKAIRLDVTGPASVAAAAEEARDTSALINNAGRAVGAYAAAKSADAARATLDGIASRAAEIVVDDRSRQVQADLSGGVAALYPQLG